MIEQALQLSHKYLDHTVMIHSRRLAQRAIDFYWGEEVIAACYGHEVLQRNYDNYYEILQEYKAIDKNVAKIIEKVTKKDNETWGQYYYRVSVVPEAAKVTWLDLTDSIVTANAEDFMRILEQLPKFHNIIFL